MKPSSTRPSPVRTTPHSREAFDLVNFAAKWHPYGGASAEEIMVTFGLTPELYELRLGHALDFYRSEQLHLSQELHRNMRSFCWKRVERRERGCTRTATP